MTKYSKIVTFIYIWLAIIFLLSSLIYFGQSGDINFHNPFKPSYFYYLTYAVTIFLLGTNRLRWDFKNSQGFLYFFIMYMILHILWIPYSPSDEIYSRTLTLRINDIIVSICFLIILSYFNDDKTIILLPRYVMWATSLFNVFVFFFGKYSIIKFGVFEGRAAGLYGDPNQCATFMAISIPLICMNAKFHTRIINYLIVGIGILLTFSREGMLLWAVASSMDVLYYLWQDKRQRVKNIISLSLMVLGVFGLILFAMEFYDQFIYFMRPFVNADTLSRLSFSDKGSGSQRMELAQAGLDMFSQSPFWGNGYASTRAWDLGLSVHNMFILFFVEFGILGGILYFLFLFNVFKIKSGLGWIVGSLVFFESFFTHSYFDLPYYSLLIFLYWKIGINKEKMKFASIGKDK